MKSYVFLSILIIIFLGCEQESEEIIYSEMENKEYPYSAEPEQDLNNLFWVGTYEGVFPDNQCKEMKTELSLSSDFTFTKTTNCLSHNYDDILHSGDFEWDEINNLITLNDSNKSQFRLHKDYIVYLNPQTVNEEHKMIRINKIAD